MRYRYFYRKKAKLFSNSGDPDQTPHSAASDLGLHCLPKVTRLGVSQLQWVNGFNRYVRYWSKSSAEQGQPSR